MEILKCNTLYYNYTSLQKQTLGFIDELENHISNYKLQENFFCQNADMAVLIYDDTKAA